MSFHQPHLLPTRRDFGIGYLALVGVLLTSGVCAYGFSVDETGLETVVSVAIAASLIAIVSYSGYTFYELSVSDSLVWGVAQWTSLGIGVATVLALTVGLAARYVPMTTIAEGLVVATIVTGALTGALAGTVIGVREQQRQVGTLTERNAVLNRVLRHNIKNEMNVIIGHVSLLSQQGDGDVERSLDVIRRAATDVTRLSETARTIDKLGTAPEGTRIDLSQIVRQAVDSANSYYADAEFIEDVPPTAWVRASPLVGTVVANLLENAVEHNSQDVRVEVLLERNTDDGEYVHLAVGDNGPGIYDHEREVLDAGEDPVTHGSGMGLWLVKWFTHAYDGRLWFEDNEPRGTVVHLELPVAEGGSRDAGRNPAAVASAVVRSGRWD